MRGRGWKAATLIAAAVLAGTLAGCSSPDQKEADPQPQQQAAEKQEASIEGTLVSFSGKDLVMESNAQSYTFDVSEATVSAANMVAGDEIVVHYEGDLDADGTKGVNVTLVEDKGAAPTQQQEQQVVGSLVDMSMNTITVKQNDGTEITFNSSNCEHDFVNGMREGNWVVVTYLGTINGTDGSSVKVVKITDNDPNTVEQAKQQMNIKAVDETTYATAGVHIRASYSTDSEVLGNLAQGQSIQRTGVCDNGWSRVNYNGTDAYIYGDYLTTQAPTASAAPAKTSGEPAATPQTEGGEPAPVVTPVPAPEPDPTPAPEPTQQTATGTVKDASMNTLTVEIDGVEITLNVTDAQHHYKNGIQTGNSVSITYTGELTSDPSTATVVSVEDDDANAATNAVYTGAVTDGTMNTVTIVTDDGATMTFAKDEATDTTGGLITGTRVDITVDSAAASDDSTVIPAISIDLAAA